MKNKIISLLILGIFILSGLTVINLNVKGNENENKINVLGDMTEYATVIGVEAYDICFNSHNSCLYFTERTGDNITKMTENGVFTRYENFDGAQAIDICYDSHDNCVYFLNYGRDRIGKLTESGILTDYTITNADYDLHAICFNSHDNCIYYVLHTANKIGKMTESGSCTNYGITTAGSNSDGICFDSNDNRVYTYEGNYDKICAMTEVGVCTEYSTGNHGIYPSDLCFNSHDNCIYYPDASNTYEHKINKITESGSVTKYITPLNSNVYGICYSNYDNCVYFTYPDSNEIGKMTEDGAFNSYGIISSDSYTEYLCFDTNNFCVYYAEGVTDKIGKMDTGYVASNPQLDNYVGCIEPEPDNNYTEGETLNYIFNGTGTDLLTGDVCYDIWLYYQSNTTYKHFNNGTGDFSNTKWYVDDNLTLPSVNGNQVCKFRIRVQLLNTNLLLNVNNQIEYYTIWGYSGDFTILDTSSISTAVFQSPSSEMVEPKRCDNYSYNNLVEVHESGLGVNLDLIYDMYIDYWLYFYSNDTKIHYLNTSANIVGSDNWYCYANFTNDFVENTSVCKIISRIQLIINDISLFNKNKNIIETVTVDTQTFWHDSYDFILSPILTVSLTNPNGYENYSAGETINITFDISGGYNLEPFIYNVTLFYTLDNGTSWNIIDENVTYDNGINTYYEWDTTGITTHTTYYAYVYLIVYDLIGNYNDDGSNDNFTLYVAGSCPIQPPEKPYKEPENTNQDEEIPEEPTTNLFTQYQYLIIICIIVVAIMIFVIYSMFTYKPKRHIKHRRKYKRRY